jgi:ATP-dependent 26S proteasome regulatory subunit
MRKIPLEFSLYENVYSNDVPLEQYFVILFDYLPSKYSTKNLYSKDIIKYFTEGLKFVEETRVVSGRRYIEQTSESLFVNQSLEIIINISQNLLKEPDLVSIEILYNIKNGEIDKQLDFDIINDFKRIGKKSSIQLVKSDMGHLDTEEYDLVIPEIDLELNYGIAFLKIHETIVKRLNTQGDKGIILLHGDPGTGKTSYIKFLTHLITDKDILFIPPSMAEMLSEPSIIPFLMDHKNSILLIEDAERVIADREGKGSPVGVSNLLNLTDGILGDCLNIQVIATFNMKRERIDSALLRKGRLICEHKFDLLSLVETNKLLLHLGKGITSGHPLTLADIYNIDSDPLRITKEADTIGFKQK